MQILKTVLTWIYQHIITFFVIVALLIGVTALKREYIEHKTLAPLAADIQMLEEADRRLEVLIADQKSKTIDSVDHFREATVTELDARLVVIDRDISNLYKKQCNPPGWIVNFNQCVVIGAESNIRIAIREQERFYLQQIRESGSIIINKDMCKKELQELKTTFLDTYKHQERNEALQRWWEINYPNRIRIPWTQPYEEYEKLKDAHPRLFKASKASLDSYKRQEKICAAIDVPQKIAFTISNISIDKARLPLVNKIAEIERKLSANWWRKFLQIIRPVIEVIPAALLILISAILAPMAIKAFLYFIVAPLASRRPSNCLMPETSGAIDGLDATNETRKGISDVSKEIKIVDTDELLIDAKYIQSSSDTGSADTKWLLDYRFPLSSLVSGMYGLTRFRVDSKGTYVASAMNEPLSQIALIAIPAGSAFVLKPHCLIGIVQHIDHPVMITRHWRIGSLHAWLTLQLRYLVFHGPVSLIVTGCGGVSVEQAGQGRRINQAATIGFSANLPYATTRCETFTAYLTGKQELFNDYFPSGPGYFIYEEKPLFGKKSNFVVGRGLEGITDSILKLFGV